MSVATNLADVTVEIGFGVDAVGGPYLVLDDPVKGVLDNVSYTLAPTTVMVDITTDVASVSTTRGRQRELDEYATGTATVVINDNDRTYDPSYSGSPYYGQLTPIRRIRIAWDGTPIFTGWVEDWTISYEAGDQISRVTVDCVDAFAILANQELAEIVAARSGELVGTRIAAVLDLPEVDFPASRAIDAGTSTLGATTLGDNALSYLQACTRAEAGYLFVAADGTLTFRSRTAVLNMPGDAVLGDRTPAVTAYLTPTVGTAWTANPGVPPNQCTFVFKTTGPSTTNVTLAAQWFAQHSWQIFRSLPDTVLAVFEDSSSVDTVRTPAGVPVANDDTFALIVDMTAGTVSTAHLFGGAWRTVATTTGPAFSAPRTSTDWVQIGSYNQSLMTQPFDGRIYSVELRTGLNPAAGTGVTALPGAIKFVATNGNHASIPDAANLDIVGDITIVARVASDDWFSAQNSMIVSKWGPSTSQLSYRFYLVAGTLIWEWSASGTSGTFVGSAAHGIPNGQPKWMAVTFDVDNTAGGRSTRFWLSDDGLTWTQLGSTSVAAGVTSIFASTSDVNFGANNTGGNFLAGSISHLSIRNGIGASGAIGGTEVFRLDGFNDMPPSISPTATTIVATTGQTVTINRSGSPSTSITPGTAGTVWKFDAGDYPGTGTSYTDPRGRVWTLTSAAAITPTTAGIPYRNLTQRSAADLLYTRVTGESETTTVKVTATDTAATDQYFIRTLPLGSLLLLDDTQTQNLVNYYLERFSTPEQRFQAATLNVAALTAAQVTTLIGLDLTDVVTVERSPLNVGATINRLSLIDGIHHRIGHGSWTMDVTFANADTRLFITVDGPVLGALDAYRLAF